MPRPKQQKELAPPPDEAEEPDEQTEKTEQTGSTSLLKYYHDISKIPCLTAPQERAIGAEIIQEKSPSRRKAAIAMLIECNLRLVIKWANRYQGRGLRIEDLIQEGNFGLMKAASKFDIQKGCRFSTYATWWIRQAITRALSNIGHTIRIPIHAHQKVNKMFRVIGDLRQQLGRNPDIDEIADAMDISLKKALALYEASHLDCSSLDAFVSDDETTTMLEMTPDKNSPDPMVEVSRKNTAETVNNTLAILKPRDRYVMEMRYGINTRNEKDHTLEEVGNSLGVTRERIRQIQAHASKRLRLHLTATFGEVKKKPRL